jgi:hypothetical protein
VTALCDPPVPSSEDLSTDSRPRRNRRRSGGSANGTAGATATASRELAGTSTGSTDGAGGSLATAPAGAMVAERSSTLTLEAASSAPARSAGRQRKPCIRCGGEKPAGRGLHLCENCNPRRHAGNPRACHDCGEVKPADAFDYGDGTRGKGVYRRRRRFCRECWERRDADAEEKAARADGNRVTWRRDDGRLVRRCCRCKEVKELEAEFYNSRRPRYDGEPVERRKSFMCRTCQVARVSSYQRQRRERDPETVRAEKARWQREWRKRNPERARELDEGYEMRRAADPVRRAAKLESDRMAYRLRRLRRGLPVRDIAEPPKVSPHLQGDSLPPATNLPARPLMEAVLVAVAEERRVMNPFGHPLRASDHEIAPLKRVCERAHINERMVNAWQRGERLEVQFAIADRALIGLGLFWWEVWLEPQAPAKSGPARDVLAHLDALEEYVSVRKAWEGSVDEWLEEVAA